jgi:hypothetical protein
MRLQEALHQRRRAGTIHVIVAEHGHRLAALDGIGKARGTLVHVVDDAGIRHQCLDRRIEHQRHLGDADPARREHAAKQLGEAVLLADRRGDVAAGRIQAFAPGETARRGADAEEKLVRGRYLGLEPCECHTPPVCESNERS